WRAQTPPGPSITQLHQPFRHHRGPFGPFDANVHMPHAARLVVAQVVDPGQPEAAHQGRAAGHRRRKTHLVEAVVQRQLAARELEQLVIPAGDQRQREQAVGNGGAERRLGRGAGAVHVDPLPVMHHLGVGIDGGLVDHDGAPHHRWPADESLEGRNGIEAGFFHGRQSACTPSDLASGIHCLRSASMKPANSCCEPGMGWAPMRRSFSTSAGCCSAWLMAWFMASMAGCGVPARAITPNQAAASSPGNPSSRAVGTSASCGNRWSSRMASGTMRPACACAMHEGSASNMMSMLPPIRLVMAGALPLNGTWVTLKPIWLAACSPARWVMLPLLAEPMVSLPSSRLPSATSAGRSAAPRSLRVTSSSGALPMPATGMKSL